MRIKLLSALAILILLVAYPCGTVASHKTITIAVIDTGIDYNEANLCKFGHKSFVDKSPLLDSNGHGTHVAGLINKNAGQGNYCLVALKYYSNSNTGIENQTSMIKAIEHAINIKVDFINISGGGLVRNTVEQLLVAIALAKGITIVAAAGNRHTNLDADCDFFPACYDDRIVTVGNLHMEPHWRSPSSNYGNYVKRWEVGTDVLSTLPGDRVGTMSGTSQATAVATGKLVHDKLVR